MQHRPTSRQTTPVTPNSSLGYLSRREALIISVGALGAAAGGFGTSVLAPPALAADEVESHGMSAFGDLKYPPDFKHFDYVNPNAPKGGSFSYLGGVRQYNQNFLTFNSLNVLIYRGDGALGHTLHALADVLGVACQSLGCKAFGCSLLGDIGEDFSRCALGGIEAGGGRLAGLALDGIACLSGQVILDIAAAPGAGNLLGNLLCAVTGLLDGPAGGLAALLNQILGILG